MDNKNMIRSSFIGILTLFMMVGCTNLDQHVYSVVQDQNFWQTPEQIASGIAPGYQALTSLPDGDMLLLNEATTDAMIIPTRGGDWYNGGVPQALWKHTWTPKTNAFDGAWNNIYNGVGRVNFALNALNQLENQPDNIESIVAELKVLRAYFYYWAMDLFGNIPIVTDFNTNPNSVSNSSRKEAFSFLEKELKENIDHLSESTGPETYGKVNKWVGYALLAKLYLNAEVYTGKAHWQDCIDMTDSIINAGQYSLSAGYFDNFSTDNQGSVENIFVVPFDKINIPGNNWENQTLHYQNVANFQLAGSTWNGYSANKGFYKLFDTTSVYTKKENRIYRTYLDQRSGQWLIGQQYSLPYPFPPDKNILYKAEDSLKLKDKGTGLDLSFTPKMDSISSPSSAFRLAGVRNIKYFPEAGTAGNQSNDMVLFRYADILLMKAECEVRLGQNLQNALDLVNQVRERAYSGDQSHDWTMSDLTLENILDERGRELAWELWRRQDLIRYEIASGTHYYTGARVPAKAQDPADGHTLLFPIPENQIIANPNLKQNPGY